MATSVTIPLLTTETARGNVRPLASQVRSDSAAAADALKNVQDQIDQIRKVLAVGVTINTTSLITADNFVTINGIPVTY